MIKSLGAAAMAVADTVAILWADLLIRFALLSKPKKVIIYGVTITALVCIWAMYSIKQLP